MLKRWYIVGTFFCLLLYTGKLLYNVTIEKLSGMMKFFVVTILLCCTYRSMFRDELLPWLRHVTGLQLTDTIDMTCSKYNYTGKCFCSLVYIRIFIFDCFSSLADMGRITFVLVFKFNLMFYVPPK